MKFITPDIQKIITFVNGLSKRERTILYFAAAFILLMGADRLVVSPITGELASINERIDKKESEIMRGLHILSNKERIISEISAYESFLKKPPSDEDGATELLKEMENLASKNGVYIITIRSAGVKTEGPAKRFSVTLECESAMPDLVAFLAAVENSKQIYILEKIQITPKQGDPYEVQCGMTISKVNIF